MSGRTFAAQDLPPKGGYTTFDVARKNLPGIFKPRYFLALYAAVFTIGFFRTRKGHFNAHRDELEMKSAKNAILPILMAEKDRRLLKHMKKMRERETELMKDSEGWTVGKYYGEPIYLTQGDDYFVAPTWQEYYLHGNHKMSLFYNSDSLFM